jgi:hypothetical protein
MSGRRLLVLALVPYALWLVLAYRYHFLDGVNLAFHEAGHLFLRPFGRTLHVLGGTLAQLAVPALCVGHFFRQERRFEAAVCGVWLGESALYAGRYIADAQAMALPLVGGHIHDWNWLLTKAGLLHLSGALGGAVHVLGSLVLVASLVLAWRLAPADDAGRIPGFEEMKGSQERPSRHAPGEPTLRP